MLDFFGCFIRSLHTLSACLLFNLKERGRTICTNSSENSLRKLLPSGRVVLGGFPSLDFCADRTSALKVSHGKWQSVNQETRRVQKSMGYKVPSKRGMLIYLPVISQPFIFLQRGLFCRDSLHSEFLSPCNIATQGIWRTLLQHPQPMRTRLEEKASLLVDHAFA